MSVRVVRSDIQRIAELLVEVGQRLGKTTSRNGIPMAAGEAAWRAADEFAPGLRASSTGAGAGGHGTNLRDPDTLDLVPNDSTGEAAVHQDPTGLTLARYRSALGFLLDNALDLRDLLGDLLPRQPNTRIEPCSTCGTPRTVDSKRRRDLVDADVVNAGYCKSCWRNDKRLEPIQTRRPNGARYYKEHCRWCGSFRAEWGIEPPLALVVLRHTYGRVTPEQVYANVPKKVLAAHRRRNAAG